MAILSGAVAVMPQEIRIAESYLKMLYFKKAVSLLRVTANYHTRKLRMFVVASGGAL
jgi:hypothetical protein